MAMEQPQGRPLLTLSLAGSPRLWFWGDALQCTRGGIFSEGRQLHLQQAGPTFRGGRREAEHRDS